MKLRAHFPQSRTPDATVATPAARPDPGDNRIVIVEDDGTRRDVTDVGGLGITFKGSGAIVEIAAGAVFRRCRMVVGTGARAWIGRTHRRGICNTEIRLGVTSADCRLRIGNNVSIASARIVINRDDGLDVRIGDDCMFSDNIVLRASDGHVLYDTDTGTILNRAEPMVIGDHVWVGDGAILLKGCALPNNTVVGARAVVSRRFTKEYTAIAGNPAVVLRENVGWDRRNAAEWRRDAAPGP